MTRRILIVDDVATNRILLGARLRAAGHAPLLAEDGADALQLARTARPDLILAEGGGALLRGLRADPALAEIPVIAMLAGDCPAARLAALRQGADDAMTKPLDEDRLLARLRALMRAREATGELRARDAALGPIGMTEPAAGFDRPGRVVLVSDDAARARGLCAALSPLLRDRLAIRPRQGALALSEGDARDVPDLYLIDAGGAQDGDALRLVADLRSQGGSRHAAVSILQRAPDARAEAMALDMGADDVVPAGAEAQELALRLRRLLERKRRDDALRARLCHGLRLAAIDPLTGLYNRRYALAQLGRIAERAAQDGSGFAVLVIDVDHFKTVNDAFGHATGDAVLTEVARRMASALRPGDLLGRIGGEEFIAVLPETGVEGAVCFAERLCSAVERTPMDQARTPGVTVTVSVGLAVASPADGATADLGAGIVARADRALLQSKARGRNRVTIDRSAA